MFFRFLIILFLLTNIHSFGKIHFQDSIPETHTPVDRAQLPVGINKLQKASYRRFSNIKVSGFVRTFIQYRNMPVRYSEIPDQQQVAINGFDVRNRQLTGFPDPLLYLTVEGQPTYATYFKINYAFDDVFLQSLKSRGGNATAVNHIGSPYRLMQFEAGANTVVGDFKLIAGAPLLWYKLSPFTMGSYQYREDIFERYSWAPKEGSFDAYNRYYMNQNIQREQRWGYSGFQGFILEGKNLPKGFGATLMYGRTDNSGGFQIFPNGITKLPTRNTGAGRVEKYLGNAKIGANFFDQSGYTDNIARFKTRQQIVTTDLKFNFRNIAVYVEAGMGRYQDSIVQYDSRYKAENGNWTSAKQGQILGLNYNWHPALNAEFDFGKKVSKIPFAIQIYYIDKSVVNTNSEIINSANPHAVANPLIVGTSNDITTFQGLVTNPNQMTNNRWGVNLRHNDSYGKVNVLAGLGANQELDNLFNTIYFQHQANAYTRSRFNFFQSYTGPYGRIKSVFRRTYEMIRITDTSANYKKSYATVELGLKYKFSFLAKEFVVSNYVNYNSVQDKFSPLPYFSDKAFLRTFYEELTGFYALLPKVSLIGLISFEKNLGNDRTELADASGNLIAESGNPAKPIKNTAGNPINQFGYGLGLGVNYSISKNTSIYLRNRWFSFKDKNFVNDRFKGTETSLELKIFF